MTRALFVGAGAVGATYGAALRRGGAAVSFYVKEKYVDEVRGGLKVFEGRDKTPYVVEPEEVICSPEELAEREFDQVWLTMSSTALQGDWRKPLLDATGDATIVSLQPGIGDHDIVREETSIERVVSGLITFAAWSSPMEGQGPEGIVYVIPPFGAQPFSGPRAASVAEAVRAGGMKSRVVDDAERQGRVGSAAMNPMIASLEASGWKFETWDIDLGTRAVHESFVAIDGVPVGLKLLLRPFPTRVVLPFAGMLFPCDLETYVRVHFTKVGDQTRSSLGRLIEAGRAAGTSTSALEDLKARLDQLDAA